MQASKWCKIPIFGGNYCLQKSNRASTIVLASGRNRTWKLGIFRFVNIEGDNGAEPGNYATQNQTKEIRTEQHVESRLLHRNWRPRLTLKSRFATAYQKNFNKLSIGIRSLLRHDFTKKIVFFHSFPFRNMTWWPINYIACWGSIFFYSWNAVTELLFIIPKNYKSQMFLQTIIEHVTTLWVSDGRLNSWIKIKWINETLFVIYRNVSIWYTKFILPIFFSLPKYLGAWGNSLI